MKHLWLTFILVSIIVVLWFQKKRDFEKDKEEFVVSNDEPVVAQPNIYDYVQYRRDNDWDRFVNPLRFPYKRYSYAQPYINGFNNLYLPSEVIGCGGRRGPCYGGSQVTIPNYHIPLSVSNANIAPINIRTRGYEDDPQQVGILYKIMGNENSAKPLFGKRLYGDRWTYYTLIGPNQNIKAYVKTPHDRELGTNDVVKIEGSRNIGEYRVSLYDNDIPNHLPFF